MRNIAYLLLGILLGGVLASLIASQRGSRAPHAPRYSAPGRLESPSSDFEIKPGRKYDLTCVDLTTDPGSAAHESRATIFAACEILGVTGRAGGYERADAASRSSISLASMAGETRTFFENWLVLKRPDGRLVYVPTNSVRMIEESATFDPSKPDEIEDRAKISRLPAATP
jgi:hypothetical protein